MVYTPSAFAGDPKLLRDFLATYPFATLISVISAEEAPQVSHLPLMCLARGEDLFLEGHLARANPHASVLKSGSQHLAIFHGPDSYISPTWYVSGRDVPTWNYAVAHLHLRSEACTEGQETVELLRRLSDRFENLRPKPWAFSLPKDLIDVNKLNRAILGFRMRVTKTEFKLKFGQNRSREDQRSMQEHLSQEPHPKARELLEWMERSGTGPP